MRSGQKCNVGDLYSNSNHVSICPHLFQMFMREKSELSIFNTLYSTLKESFQNGSLKHWSNKVISKRIRRRKYIQWIDFDLSLQRTWAHTIAGGLYWGPSYGLQLMDMTNRTILPTGDLYQTWIHQFTIKSMHQTSFFNFKFSFVS